MATTSSSSAFHEANPTFGMPAKSGSSDYVHQHYAETCAVQCQRLILNQFGIGVTEEQLVKEAEKMGIYSPGSGTRLEDVGKLLEAHGVPVHREMDSNVFHLATELAQGHKVIVGLDSGDLWHTHTLLESIAETFGMGGADHAVIVAAIDTADPDHVKVIVTDPGTGDIAKAYDLPDFVDAWKGSHFSMISTTHPTPAINPEMVNFDYQTGHIPNVGAVPYDLVSAMSQVAGHESDPTALGRLEHMFDQMISGNAPMGDFVMSPGSEPHHSFYDLATGLLSIVHHSLRPGSPSALLEPFLQSGGGHHEHDAHHDRDARHGHFDDTAMHYDHHHGDFHDASDTAPDDPGDDSDS